MFFRFIKVSVFAVVFAIIAFCFSSLCMYAWDNSMTDTELFSLLEKYPEDENLIKIARNRGYDGACDLSEEHAKEFAISDLAMQLYISALDDPTVEAKDFEYYYKIAESFDSFESMLYNDANQDN